MQRIGRSILLKSMACYPPTSSPKPSYLTSMIPFPPPNHPNPRENQVFDRVKGDVDSINAKIPQVQAEIKYATESKGMRDELPENERSALRQSMGPKIEQLKAEFEIITWFAEAREDIGNAMGMEQDGVYKAELVIEMFERLLRMLRKKSALRQSMGPKIEQLKAEFRQMEVDEISTWFTEAREDIENAMGMERDGVYARYTAKSEQYKVELVFEMFERLLRLLPKKSALRRSMGPKFVLMKAEFHQVEVVYFNTKIAEAREKIKAAMESKEMEDAECAREAVNSVLGMFDDLLAKLPENSKLRRLIGLKIELLKAEISLRDE